MTSVQPSSRYDNTTLTICGSASGHLINPLIIFRAIQCEDEWTSDWPEVDRAANTSGYMSNDIFRDWLEKVFVEQAMSNRPPGYNG